MSEKLPEWVFRSLSQRRCVNEYLEVFIDSDQILKKQL